MSRLTDEEIREMPLNEADAYLETHPDEAQHFAKVFATATAKQAKKRFFICVMALSKVAEKQLLQKRSRMSAYGRGQSCSEL